MKILQKNKLQTINYMFNNKLKGKSVEEINEPLEKYLYKEMKDSVRSNKTNNYTNKKSLFEDEKVYLEGARQELGFTRI